ncbi:MAG: DUF1840 domain-containing protein [Burkholderiaceae bacterium]|nr:DUF1840 domain-containing protein [Burkholderiaceae bacterium]
MLVTFKSKAAAEVLMYETHARPILDLLGKSVERGVITAEETGAAIHRIEAEITDRKEAQAAQHEAAGRPADEQDDDAVRGDYVSFGTRAYPLLEMLRAAHREQAFVMWGV